MELTSPAILLVKRSVFNHVSNRIEHTQAEPFCLSNGARHRLPIIRFAPKWMMGGAQVIDIAPAKRDVTRAHELLGRAGVCSTD